MDPKPQPQGKDYLKYLEGLIDEKPVEIGVRTPEDLKRPAESVSEAKQSPALYIVGGIVVLALVFLIVRGILSPREYFSGSPSQFAQLQEESRTWAWSSAKSMLLERHKNQKVSEVAWDKVETKYLGDDRWHVVGALDSENGQGVQKQSKWEIDVKYLPDKKSGELLKVSLDGTMIYAK